MHTLVSLIAPDFTTSAVLADGTINNDFNLRNAIKDKYALLFFYPLNFTFVCPSELVALHNRMTEFKARGVEVIAVSVDSQFSHLAWRQMPYEQGGIGKVDFILAADTSHAISQSYGVEHPDANVAFRAAFLIDKHGVIRVQQVNDLPIGRNIDELIRLVDAIEHHQQHGEVCPAGWTKGDEAMQASKDGVSRYLGANAVKL